VPRGRSRALHARALHARTARDLLLVSRIAFLTLASAGHYCDYCRNPQGGAQMQMKYPEPACKYTAKIDNADRIPFFVEQAVRYCINGRPGAAYLEIGGDTLREMVPAGTYFPPMCPDPPLQEAAQADVAAAIALLKSAKAPLVIVGKGAAYAGATEELLKFVESSGCPFLPTPMGKGCLPDDHELCIAPARSAALSGADVVVLVGARLNWILHFVRRGHHHHSPIHCCSYVSVARMVGLVP
jgi:2-hydroxyacyl-CoA lyase 1